ncbi:E3 ubiquitin-protein ligase PRT1 isoform X1 [Coffea arabica]|uniref:E3 ubiquitin-protein ligase PRT1 isoform X1 n=1 Tax=Coffea arabica TaxID=13443 RepID=A0A6P6UV98_COFAR|nr:E3 ubiquitin-protein ligase PRT1-like [Coffea arabica]
MEISDKVKKLLEDGLDYHDDSSEKISESFICCVCLQLLYKPVVLVCGHISCFWCVQKSMSGLRESHCPRCRHPYHHFPTICQMLHFLLFKMYPVAYQRREIQIREYEKEQDCFSPQFNGPVRVPQTEQELNHTDSSQRSEISSLDLSKDPSCSGNSKVMFNMEQPESGLIDQENLKMAVGDIEATSSIVDRGDKLHQGIANGTRQPISVDDALCTLCNQLLYHPVVLNCGHAYCESCIVTQTNETVKCQKCESRHPGQTPKVCLEFDNFLKEQFPADYALRRSIIQLKQSCSQRENLSTCSSEPAKENSDLLTSSGENAFSWWGDHKVHIGAGCDSCGVYPIIGDRYRCKDCTELIGYDLCGDCYNTCSKLPGRFNQQHTPEHKFEVRRPNSMRNIMLRLLQLGDGSAGPNAISDVSGNSEIVVRALSDDAQETAESGFGTPNETEEDQNNHQ